MRLARTLLDIYYLSNFNLKKYHLRNILEKIHYVQQLVEPTVTCERDLTLSEYNALLLAD